MSKYAYVDTSALAKLIKPESETDALRVELSEWNGALISSTILEPELRRVAVRAGVDQKDCDQILTAVTLLDLGETIRRRTGVLGPPELRALDAIHLSTAMELGPDLAILYAYDDRLVDAALLQGIPTRAPAPGP